MCSCDNKFSFHLTEYAEGGADVTSPINFTRQLPASFITHLNVTSKCKITLTSATIDMGGEDPGRGPAPLIQASIPQFWVQISGLGIRNQTFLNLYNRGDADNAGMPDFVNNGWFQVNNQALFQNGTTYNIVAAAITDDNLIYGCGDNNISISKMCSNSFGGEIQISCHRQYQNDGIAPLLFVAGQKFSISFDIEFIK